MDPIDKILSSEPDLEPSSGFAEAVMRSVAVGAASSSPFPWIRLAAGSTVCVAIAWAVARLPVGALAVSAEPASAVIAQALAPAAPGLAVAALALCVTMGGLRLMEELAAAD